MPRRTFFAHERDTLLVALYATLHYLYAWWSHPLNPLWRDRTDTGWYVWADQWRYLDAAMQMASGQDIWALSHAPGYSLLAVPFVWLTPQDPYVLPNLALYIATLVLSYRLVRALLSWQVALLTVVLLSQSDQFLGFFVEPWSNVVTVFALALLLTLALPQKPPRRPWLVALLVGLTMSWTLSARYGDVALLLPVALLALYCAGNTWPQRFWLAGLGGLAALPLVAWVAALHTFTYGSPLITPYAEQLSPLTGIGSQDFATRSFSYMGYHLFAMWFSPLPFADTTRFPPAVQSTPHRALLAYYFVIVFAGVGFLWLQRTRRLLIWSFGASLALALLYYGTFWSTSGYDLRFQSLRFFAAWQPMLLCLGVAGLLALVQADWHSAHERRVLLVGLALPLCFGLGLYGLGRWHPPFPDTARLLNSFGWEISTTTDTTHSPYHLLDRHVAQVWHIDTPSSAADDITLTLDMQRAYLLHELFLANPIGSPAPPAPRSLHVSYDGITWHTPALLRTTQPAERLRALRFAPTAARFVRITVHTPQLDAVGSIGELYLYGQRIPVQMTVGTGCATDTPIYQCQTPAQFQVAANYPARVLLHFALPATAPDLHALDILVNNQVIGTVPAQAGQHVQIGPFGVPVGVSTLTLRAHSPKDPTDRLHETYTFALDDVRLHYLERDWSNDTWR
jgi:hypothetical protein